MTSAMQRETCGHELKPRHRNRPPQWNNTSANKRGCTEQLFAELGKNPEWKQQETNQSENADDSTRDIVKNLHVWKIEPEKTREKKQKGAVVCVFLCFFV
jgi:hypothetical protein